MSEKQDINDKPITTQTEALQLLVNALNLAQKRGTFSIMESAKIAEAVQMFQPKNPKEKLATVEEVE